MTNSERNSPAKEFDLVSQAYNMGEADNSAMGKRPSVRGLIRAQQVQGTSHGGQWITDIVKSLSLRLMLQCRLSGSLMQEKTSNLTSLKNGRIKMMKTTQSERSVFDNTTERLL